jgi:hypothetical protein
MVTRKGAKVRTVFFIRLGRQTDRQTNRQEKLGCFLYLQTLGDRSYRSWNAEV